MAKILIADSGSTKTDWALGDVRVTTQGINPFHQDDESILGILREELRPALKDEVEAIRFYGSGVRPELEARMEGLLRQVFGKVGDVSAKSDMLGAARALCGRHEGLACILGTGANSCLYDGERIVMNTPAMGYILGDEGSGATLGKEFLNALYKGRLYEGAREEFEAETGMTMADVITKVYRQPVPNRWLASLSKYIHRHLKEPTVRNIVVENFRKFISHNVRPYGRQDLALGAVGSIAYFYRAQLEEAIRKEGYTVGEILRGPLDGLVRQTV